jgi:methionyl-tRNA formyltransferase
MNDRMDAGDIVLQEGAGIGPEDNAGSLEARLAGQGADLMVRCLEELAAGRAAGRSQDEALATMAPKLAPEDLVIDWNRPCLELRNMVRGLAPRPGARTFFRGKQLEVGEVRVTSNSGGAQAGREPGMVVGCDSDDRPLVVTADGVLALGLVKPEGKKLMAGGEFARGYRPRAGERLG